VAVTPEGNLISVGWMTKDEWMVYICHPDQYAKLQDGYEMLRAMIRATKKHIKEAESLEAGLCGGNKRPETPH
jgi:hypothetical protein